MSWDILIMDLPDDARSVAELPEDFAPSPLGARSQVIGAIQAVAPDTDFSDPSWGQLVTPDFVVEFNVGSEAVTESVMLHVRGGDAVVGLVGALLDQLNASAIDCSTGDFFEPSSATESLRAWRAFRDGIVGGH